MRLRGTNYGNILGASGIQGFFGEGYRFHKRLRLLGLAPDFTGMTFVAKTTTLFKQAGNMPLNEYLEPTEFKPKCIYVNLFKSNALNAVGLSGPGAEPLLDLLGPSPRGMTLPKWQFRTEPFMISFMPTGKTVEDRLEEMRQFVKVLKKYLPQFKAKIALQINISCPNVGLDPLKLSVEVERLLDMAAELGIPLIPKFNALVPPELVVKLSYHESYDATCVSNTIPFGKLEELIPWKYEFPRGSPLEKFGGGGLSGKHLLPIVGQWISKAYESGMIKPMNVGGGILNTRNINYLIEQGLRPGIDSVFIGSIAMFRPWRVQRIIQYANRVLAP